MSQQVNIGTSGVADSSGTCTITAPQVPSGTIQDLTFQVTNNLPSATWTIYQDGAQIGQVQGTAIAGPFRFRGPSVPSLQGSSLTAGSSYGLSISGQLYLSNEQLPALTSPSGQVSVPQVLPTIESDYIASSGSFIALCRFLDITTPGAVPLKFLSLNCNVTTAAAPSAAAVVLSIYDSTSQNDIYDFEMGGSQAGIYQAAIGLNFTSASTIVCPLPDIWVPSGSSISMTSKVAYGGSAPVASALLTYQIANSP